jgi:DHA1 family bicyclomycin/chloramphenicol resistance-like MFS transporter
MTAVSAYMVLSLALLALTIAGATGLAVLMIGLFLAFACLGLVIPSSMVMALEEHGPIAGVASALGGTLQFLTGAVMITVASLLFDGTSLPMVAIIAACSVGAFALAMLTLRRRPATAPQPEPAE